MDEHANFVTHGFGLLLAVLGSAVLMELVRDNHRDLVFGCAIYCFSLVGLYAASTLSHAFYDVRWRRFFRCLDQAFIFILIAGSFTPVAAEYLRDGWWPLLILAMWALALTGVAAVMWKGHLTAAAQTTYLLLGWLPVIALKTIVEAAPGEILFWILGGGLFYTVGTLFLWNDHRVRYLHALWHAFVVAGSACHFIAILLLVA